MTPRSKRSVWDKLWFKLLLAGPPFLFAAFIFAHIVHVEAAHRRADCRFVDVEVRALGVDVWTEQARRCLDAVEERRWMLKQPDAPRVEVGRRRLEPAAFRGKGYGWEVRRGQDGKSKLQVRHAEDAPRTFVFPLEQP